MPLPSHVARYDSVELLDIDQLPYLIAVRPANASLRAWSKLEETERRWTMFDWGTFVVTHPNRCERMFRDFGSAYLMSFEATIQVLLQERFPDERQRREPWLRQQPAYDFLCRGLRTLRHLEAHVRSGHVIARRDARVYSRFAGASTGGTVPRHWERVDRGDFALLQTPRIDASELPQWNDLCDERPVLALMRDGLLQLHELVAGGA